MKKSPPIDFKSERAKIVLHLVSPGGASMVDARGEIYVVLFSRTQEHAFPDAFLRFSIVYLKGTNSL